MTDSDMLDKIYNHVHECYTESYGRYALLASGSSDERATYGAAKEAAVWGEMVHYLETLMEEEG